MVSDRQFRTPLFDALVALAEARKVSFHTPGHKSGKGISTRFRKFVGSKIFTIDLTTLDEVDCLQKPVGVIKEAQELAAEAHGADRSFFLVNGTTVGNHAMVLSTVLPGDEVLVARNAHKSILAGIILSGATPRFFLPEFDPDLGIAVNVRAAAAEAAMRAHPRARVVALTSPNYYGIAADIPTIVTAGQRQGKVLIVDEAHGPHLHFHPALPPSAVDAGADLTVQSTHKIVGGMTQASMLHLTGAAVDAGRVAGVLQMLQSTSPSYILMASLDLARMQMATEGQKLLGKAIELAEEARARINRIPGLRCLTDRQVKEWGDSSLDVTKLTISVKELGLTGYAASALLNTEFDIQVEMADLWNVLVIVSIGDRRDDLDRLVRGLESLAEHHAARRGGQLREIPPIPPLHEAHLACSPRDAYFGRYAFVGLSRAVARVCCDIVTIYPPGIPILVPGEQITRAAVDYLLFLGSHGARIDGVLDPPADGTEGGGAAGGTEPRVRVLAD
ncbi:MAG TPA: aminotransferase class I/II-fold pyridoxal phosphate-dependent enzyme [Candidatus Methylomirabilis sp.]|nr:aminotransferase class I/II-fold pyridoxal phosphate-dependent enzyme [Candidatus Methylomirabilis sp.]